MRPLVFSLVILGVFVGTGCDTTVVSVDATSHTMVDRETDEVRFDITAAVHHQAFVDLDDPDTTWFEDVPSAHLDLTIETESRGFLGMNVRQTSADAWIEGHREEVFDWWLVDRDPNSRSLSIEAPIDDCGDGVCFADYTLVVVFSDPSAKVAVDVDATLFVDYDELTSEPTVALAISPAY